jgi:hypothetical protein
MGRRAPHLKSPVGPQFYVVTAWRRGIQRQIPISVSGVLSKPIGLGELRRLAGSAPASHLSLERNGQALRPSELRFAGNRSF